MTTGQPPAMVGAAKPGYSFADVLALTTATKSNLLHWRHLKIIKPGVEDVGGSGNHARYNALNVIEAQLAAKVNRFKVPVGTIQGALDHFQYFHAGMVAAYDEGAKRPATSNPPYWSKPEGRYGFACNYIKSHARYFSAAPSAWPTQDEVNAAQEQVETTAKLWHELLTGPTMRGEPSLSNVPLLKLVVSGFDYNSEGGVAAVVMNPADLGRATEGDAIVIDLVNVIWDIGQQCKRLGHQLQPW